MRKPEDTASSVRPTQGLRSLACFLYGLIAVLTALAFDLMTVAHSTGVQFAIAAVLACVGDWLLLRACQHGGPAVRVLSVIAMLPTVFILMDFAGRMPHLIRQAFFGT